MARRAGQPPAGRVPPAAGPVLLVITGTTVSVAAISRAAELADGTSVTVLGVGLDRVCDAPADGTAGRCASTEPERVRRAVALAMSAVEDAGVTADGHLVVTGSPGQAVARVARARGARVVVIDRDPAATGRPAASPAGPRGPRGSAGLAAELRRRLYGSGVTVITPGDRGGSLPGA
jgi:hypothetical protein